MLSQRRHLFNETCTHIFAWTNLLSTAWKFLAKNSVKENFLFHFLQLFIINYLLISDIFRQYNSPILEKFVPVFLVPFATVVLQQTKANVCVAKDMLIFKSSLQNCSWLLSLLLFAASRICRLSQIARLIQQYLQNFDNFLLFVTFETLRTTIQVTARLRCRHMSRIFVSDSTDRLSIGNAKATGTEMPSQLKCINLRDRREE